MRFSTRLSKPTSIRHPCVMVSRCRISLERMAWDGVGEVRHRRKRGHECAGLRERDIEVPAFSGTDPQNTPTEQDLGVCGAGSSILCPNPLQPAPEILLLVPWSRRIPSERPEIMVQLRQKTDATQNVKMPETAAIVVRGEESTPRSSWIFRHAIPIPAERCRTSASTRTSGSES